MLCSLRTVAAIASAIFLASSAFANGDTIQDAKMHFDKRHFQEVQRILDGLDLDALSATERATAEQLRAALPNAIQGQQRAAQDMADADAAFANGRWRLAERLYDGVTKNPFADLYFVERARERIASIEAQSEMGSAAAPSGPVAATSGNGQVVEVREVNPATGAVTTSGGSRSSTTVTMQPQPAPQPMYRSGGVEQVRPTEGGASISTPTPAPAPVYTTVEAPAPAPMAPQGPVEQIYVMEGATPSAANVIPPAPAGPMTVVDELRARDSLLWQRALAQLEQARQAAAIAVNERRFDEAMQEAETAIQAIETSRIYAPSSAQYESARDAALALRDDVQRDRELDDIETARREREAVAALIAERRRIQEEQRMEKIQQLFETGTQLQKEYRFDEAAEAMRQVLHLDPGNREARKLLDVYLDSASLKRQLDTDRQHKLRTRDVQLETEETKVPWNVDVLYPANWLEIGARRQGLEQITGIPEGDSELNRVLDGAFPDVEYDEQPFEQIVDFMITTGGVNIVVDYQDLEDNGIDRDAPVTLRLQEVSFRTVLEQTLQQVGRDIPLAFNISGGLLRIATKDKLDQDKHILVYDVRDLTMRIRDFEGPDVEISQAAQGGGGQGGGGQSIFGQGGGNDEDDQDDNEDAGLIDEIMDIIRTTVEPDSWRETGGGDAALRDLNGQLIVYNTSDAHQQIRDLLGQLRAQRALMLAVESRFLTVGSNFLEEIGVDLDFVFNAGEAGFDRAFNAQGQPLLDSFTQTPILVPRTASRSGLFPAVPAGGTPLAPGTVPVQPFGQAGFVPGAGGVVPGISELTPVPVNSGSINLVDPAGINTGIPGSFASQTLSPALSIAGTFLDNLQVDFLIRATQANQRSTVVQSPRLMLMNGQRASIEIVRSRQYVSTVTPQVAEGAVGVQPQQATATSGASLDVQGTISADRKYVTLTVRTALQDEPTFDRFEVQRQSGNSPGIFIELPDQLTRRVRTTVSVPDGGTVLIGGLKQIGEVEVEAGVPVLSKIPILKRAFTNSTTVKDTQTLLILLKAKILIQQEAEEEAFPTFSDASLN